MMWRWISEVPSQMRSTRASRQSRSTPHLLHQAHAAEDLHGLVGDPRQHLRGIELGHGVVLVGCAVPWSVFQAACSTSSSAAAISVAMSASLKLVPWNLPMVWPNCLRVAAHCVAISSARWARPTHCVGDGEARGAEPGVGDIEAPMLLAQDLATPARGNW